MVDFNFKNIGSKKKVKREKLMLFKTRINNLVAE